MTEDQLSPTCASLAVSVELTTCDPHWPSFAFSNASGFLFPVFSCLRTSLSYLSFMWPAFPPWAPGGSVLGPPHPHRLSLPGRVLTFPRVGGFYF